MSVVFVPIEMMARVMAARPTRFCLKARSRWLLWASQKPKDLTFRK
jgi:hypothetical protein